MNFFDIRYGEYIWPAFGITAAVFALLIAASLNLSRKWRRRYETLSRK